MKKSSKWCIRQISEPLLRSLGCNFVRQAGRILGLRHPEVHRFRFFLPAFLVSLQIPVQAVRKFGGCTTKSAVAMLAAVFLFPLSGFPAGGEIGNTRYLNYTNKVSGFQTKYPKPWSQLELGNSVSFVENTVSPVLPSAVNIASEEAEDVRTLDDLRCYVVSVSETGGSWTDITLAGRRGLQSVKNGKGTIYLLRREGEVVSVRFEIRSEGLAAKDIEVVVNSLKLD